MKPQRVFQIVAIDSVLMNKYAGLGRTERAQQTRRQVVAKFTRTYGTMESWALLPTTQRVDAPVGLRGYAGWAHVERREPVDPDYVVGTLTGWAGYVQAREPDAYAEFVMMGGV